ncbi:unnamed protein product [Phyllotreta striolata]|uniref:C2H2-type domain-containing protein n=1 Tax=Phyllotreta striolata TaxID=444603 RepID=A0A9N9TT98_PHYSR|nr:unnamed protein product [Phyllotreta striolata]
MRFEVNPNGRYMCPTCPSTYKQKGHLVRHIKYECGVEPRFQCHLCSKKFKHRSNLKSHYVMLHRDWSVSSLFSAAPDAKAKLDWRL